MNCIKCTNNKYNWLKFIAAAVIPLTIFFFIVLLFRINATNSYVYGFITFNQVLSSSINIRAILLNLSGSFKFNLATRIGMLSMAVWNLDCFRSLTLNICLNLSTLQILFLDYAIALYPLVLVIITYVMIELYARGCKVIIRMRPLHRCCARFTRIMDIQSSVIKAFATLLLISYVKIMDSTLAILLPVQVYNVLQEVVGI